PPGFQDPEFPKKVYKVEKAMYGLHQAPRAWSINWTNYLTLWMIFMDSESRSRTNCRIPAIGFLRPFGCHVMILNTLDHLGKFDSKGDEETSNDTIRNSDVHDDSQKEQDCNADVPESSWISNPTATSKVPSVEQEEPKKIFDALKDPSWVEAMQEELLQLKIQNVWVLVDCPKGVRPIGTKWVLKNKKDESGIVIRNKARLVAQGVFAPVARIKAIRLFLAYASFMGFIVYQMDVKSAFLYGTIDEEVCVMKPPGFQDPEFPKRVYKVEKAMYGLHQAPRAWYGTLSKEFEALMHDKFQISAMGELTFFLDLQVFKKKDVIFLSQDKYVGDILKKFGYLDVRSIIGSLMYLTASRLDIMFAICACARHQVTPKECHLYVVKRIFRYLKGHLKLGLWYPKESTFNLVAYSDSDYGGATQDRKSTTGGC
nr:hypothetical protein [Tanacetum cinerariifolium]